MPQHLKKIRVSSVVCRQNFKPKLIKQNKGGQNILVRVKIQDEEITLINMYTLNTGAASYIRQTVIDIKM